MKIVTLDNGRTYRIINTGQPYVSGEYPTGGFVIQTWLPTGIWSYIDNSPDMECVEQFLRLAAKNISGLFEFEDGTFYFFCAYYGSWAGDKEVVFRVRNDTTPKVRAEQKGIGCYDRLVQCHPSNSYDLNMINAWLEVHKDRPVLNRL